MEEEEEEEVVGTRVEDGDVDSRSASMANTVESPADEGVALLMRNSGE